MRMNVDMITNYREQERQALAMMQQYVTELCENIRTVDPEAKITLLDDEILIEPTKGKRDAVAQLLSGGL